MRPILMAFLACFVGWIPVLDFNFMILGEMVPRLSAEPLERYSRRHILKPLGMKDTGFKPSKSLHGRLASKARVAQKLHRVFPSAGPTRDDVRGAREDVQRREPDGGPA